MIWRIHSIEGIVRVNIRRVTPTAAILAIATALALVFNPVAGAQPAASSEVQLNQDEQAALDLFNQLDESQQEQLYSDVVSDGTATDPISRFNQLLRQLGVNNLVERIQELFGDAYVYLQRFDRFIESILGPTQPLIADAESQEAITLYCVDQVDENDPTLGVHFYGEPKRAGFFRLTSEDSNGTNLLVSSHVERAQTRIFDYHGIAPADRVTYWTASFTEDPNDTQHLPGSPARLKIDPNTLDCDN